MSLTEIARFADLAEAQIAASRLRAEGMTVHLQNEYLGGANFTLSLALGGFRLWTRSEQAEEARALIQALRLSVPPPEPEDGRRPAEPFMISGLRTALALLLFMTCGAYAAWLLAGLKRAPEGRKAVLLAIGGWLIMAICVVWSLIVAGLVFGFLTLP